MIHYIQSSGIFGALAILTGFFVAITGILIILIARSRRARFLSLLASGIPVLVGATGTLVGYFVTRESTLSNFGSDPTIIQAWHNELLSSTIIGIITAIPLLIVLGILLAIKSKQVKEIE
jgi:hypothetical protein